MILPTVTLISCLVSLVSGKSIRLDEHHLLYKPQVKDADAPIQYKPIFMLHGIDSNFHDFDGMVKQITASHPGTPLYPLPILGDSLSWLPLKYQVNEVVKYIRGVIANDTTTFSDGYHLLCHSQGGLICRSVTEVMDDHNIDTLISMAGPQMGVYDAAFFDKSQGGEIPLPPSWRNVTYEEIYLLAYTRLGQSTLSVANMWHDSRHESSFESHNVFLPYINNIVDHADKERYKLNFSRLKKAVFYVGDMGPGVTYDGGIGPWQSGVFGYSNPDGMTFSDMSQQPVYMLDTFGLRTLDESGRLVVETVKGVSHGGWIERQDIIQEWILPHLS